MAHVYADLVNELWSPTKKTVTPKSFKNELAKFNDLFGGHDQHDAQARARYHVVYGTNGMVKEPR